MILLVDNYDSFAYNLYQLIGSIDPNIKVIRNDEMTVDEIEKIDPNTIVISPGPGKPSEAGNIEEIIKYFYNKKPILGVCLGHQAICEAFGSTITYAKELMHGKSSIIKMTDDLIFQGLKQQTKAKVLKAIALSEDGEVMAVKHIDYPVYGLQFHPESILTDDGKKMIENFLGVKEND